MKRDYVMVTDKYGRHPITFWGQLTKDTEDRKIGSGYTTDIELCEKLSIEDIENCSYSDYPIIKSIYDLFKIKKDKKSAFIKIDDLLKETYLKKTCYLK